LWAVLSLTGCRAGEVFGLKRTDLDFEKRVIRYSPHVGRGHTADARTEVAV